MDNISNSIDPLSTTSPNESVDDIKTLYRKATVIDTQAVDGPDLDVAKAIEAGMTAAVVDLRMYPRSYSNAMKAMKEWNEAFEKPDCQMIKVLKASDIQLAKEQKKLGIILDCQDASILDVSTGSVNDYNIDNLKTYYDLGLRMLQLTHNERNAVADSMREKNDAGLSRLGEKVVEAMNSFGMLIDVSHCSDKTTMETIELSQFPIAVTHAGCRALYPSKRNKTDEQIRALADKGGLFGVFNMTLWMTDDKTSSIETIVDHIDHAVKIGGVDHVSFGSDGPVLKTKTPYDLALKRMREYTQRNMGLPGAERIPDHVLAEELDHPQRLLHLADALSRRGYKSGDIEKIIGGNFVRLFKDVCG